MTRIKLTRLQIVEFPNVEPTTITFHARRNVLLGKNGSGKSTLLDLLSMIARADYSAIARANFEIKFEMQLEQISVLVTLKNTQSVMPKLEGDFTSFARFEFIKDGNSTAWIEHDGKTFSVGSADTIRSGYQGYLQGGGTIFDRSFWTHLSVIFVPSLDLASENAFRFDEGLDLYKQIFGPTDQTPEVFTFGDGRAAFKKSLLVPLVTAERILSAKDRTAEIVWSASELPFLEKAQTRLGFGRCEYSLRPNDNPPSQTSSSLSDVVYGSFKARFFWAAGGYISNERLSYGQKRLLTWMHYLDCNDSFAIADELVNGLHHEWISFCLEEIDDRQAFLTSQNPLLFDFIDFPSADEVKYQFILCSAEERASRTRMKWYQMSEDKAAEFHAAYNRGVQYVSEILQTEGLW